MIVVKLIGGLGNQMYQYAYGLQLAEEYGEQICFDTTFYPEGKPLALYNLSIPQYPLWEETDIPRSQRNTVKFHQKCFHVLQKLIRVVGKTDRTGDKLFFPYAKKGLLFNFDPYYYEIPHCAAKNKYIYGYFQGEAYFAGVIDRLRVEFNVRHELSEKAKVYEKQIQGSNSVAFHIRLGDYKNAANVDLDVCSVTYYRRAIGYICDNVKDPTFFVFTNDAAQAAKMLNFPENTVFVQGTKDYEDFGLMKQCNHFVLSNSTFSWWAAYLAENAGKIVTVPEKWRHSEKDEPAIYMPYMTKLSIED